MMRIAMTKRQSPGPGWWLFEGMLLIALGGLVLYRPDILISLVAAMLIAAGICTMVFAWQVRRHARATTYQYWSAWSWADAM